MAISSTNLAQAASELASQSSSQPETMTLSLICNLRDLFSVQLPSDASVRDLYIEVSAKTSLFKTFFKLLHNYQLLADNFRLLRELNIRSGSRITLHVNIQSGVNCLDEASMTPARKTIRNDVFQLTPQQVDDFFEARQGLCIKVPLSANSIGTLKFHLDEPMPQNTEFYIEASERLNDLGQNCHLHSVQEMSDNWWRGKFHGDLVPKCSTPKGSLGKLLTPSFLSWMGYLTTYRRKPNYLIFWRPFSMTEKLSVLF